MKDTSTKYVKTILARKVEITLATIAATALSGSVAANSLYIDGSANDLWLSPDNQSNTWGQEQPYKENTYKDSVYTNNAILDSQKVGLVNWADGITLINAGTISVNTDQSGWGIDNSAKNMEALKNTGIIYVGGKGAVPGKDSYKTAIGNYGAIITTVENSGTIKVEENGTYGWGQGFNN